MLTALDTEIGSSYVDMATVCLVSAPFKSKDHDWSMTVGLVGGHKVYCLYNAGNFEAVKHLLPVGARLQETKEALQAKADAKAEARGRKTTDASAVNLMDALVKALPVVAKPKRTRPTATAAKE